MTEVLTMGTFDLLHYGHLRLLNQAAQLGRLTVGINSDKFIEKYKGEPPVLSASERARTIRALGYDWVINDGPGRDLIEELKPDIIAVGSDWLEKDYLKQIDVDQDFLRKHQISLAFIPYTVDISTTEIKKRIWNAKP